MTEVNLKLVAELARIAARYPAEDWQRLLEMLDDAAQRDRFATLLRELAAAAAVRQRPHAPSTGASQAVRTTLDDMAGSDPERAEVLEKMWSGLRSKELAPTMTSLRALAEAVGLKGAVARRRDAAVLELMQHLLTLPMGALEDAARLSVDKELGSSGDYESWVELILGRQAGST